MGWLSTYLEDRRRRQIEDDEREHRRFMERMHGIRPNAVEQHLASHRAAIVALQQENKRAHEDIAELRRFITELWEEIAELRALLREAQHALDQR